MKPTETKEGRPQRKSSQQKISQFLKVSSDEEQESEGLISSDSDEDFISDKKKRKNNEKAEKEPIVMGGNEKRTKDGKIIFELPSFLFVSSSTERPPAYLSMNDSIEEELDSRPVIPKAAAESISTSLVVREISSVSVPIHKESAAQSFENFNNSIQNSENNSPRLNSEGVFNSRFALEITDAKPIGRMAKKHTMEVETINTKSALKVPNKAIKSSTKMNKKETEKKEVEVKEVKKIKEIPPAEDMERNMQKPKKERQKAERKSPIKNTTSSNGSKNSKKRDNTSLNKWVIRKITEFPDCDSGNGFAVSEPKLPAHSGSPLVSIGAKRDNKLIIQLSDDESSDDFDMVAQPDSPKYSNQSSPVKANTEENERVIEEQKEDEMEEANDDNYPTPSPKDKVLDIKSSLEIPKPPRKKPRNIHGLFIHTYDELVVEAKMMLQSSIPLSQYLQSSHSEGENQEEEEEEFKLDQTQEEAEESKRQKILRHLKTIERAKLTIVNAQKAMEEAAGKALRMLGFDESGEE